MSTYAAYCYLMFHVKQRSTLLTYVSVEENALTGQNRTGTKYRFVERPDSRPRGTRIAVFPPPAPPADESGRETGFLFAVQFATNSRFHPSPTSTTTAIALSPAAQPVKRPYPPPRIASSSISSITARMPVGPCGWPQISEQP